MLNAIKIKNKIDSLFAPKSVAIVGATENEGKVGNVIARNVLELGYSGKVFLVNPKRENLFGRKCYKSLEEIEERVDVAIIAISADFVVETISKAAAKIKNFVVISAGFSEIGEDGKKREQQLEKIAAENKLNILGPNCLGFINPKIQLNASFAGGIPDSGSVAFVSQSGALAVAIMDIAKKESIEFSSIVSVGNKMQIDEAGLIEYFGEDKNTKVIALYLEGIKNGESFLQAAQNVSQKKPIIILKAGKTEKAQKAISSHTGALAGSDDIMSEAFKKAGVIRAENLENFFDLIRLASEYEKMKNGKAIVITNAGGPGVLTTDAFKDKKISLAEIDQKTRNELRTFLPQEGSVENPIDLLGDAQDDRYEKALEVCKKQDAEIIICVLTPQDQTPVEKIVQKIVDFRKKTKKIVVTIFIGGDKIAQGLEILKQNNIPNFNFPEAAIDSLDKFFSWISEKNKEVGKIRINKRRKEIVDDIIQKAKIENKKALSFLKAKEVMEMYGINTIGAVQLGFEQEIKIGISFPVAVKVDSDSVLHKTDKQGLILGVKNQEELEKAVSILRKNFPAADVIIQEMKKIQTELILGIKNDSIFGPIVVCGLGGIYTEVFKIADFFISPMNEKEIEKKLLEGKLAFLFQETRGQKPYDLKGLTRIIKGVMEFGAEAQDLKEFDINPLLIYNSGEKSIAIDVKIII
ncbi:MAG: hypothetical protein ACD_11C00021G0021 [uncultured bacterium]|nr:MAG: hypothetical protein ACD_11C00021G0021 [uncultured bacterium]